MQLYNTVWATARLQGGLVMSVYLKWLRYTHTILMESAAASGDYYDGDKNNKLWFGEAWGRTWVVTTYVYACSLHCQNMLHENIRICM